MLFRSKDKVYSISGSGQSMANTLGELNNLAKLAIKPKNTTETKANNSEQGINPTV